MLRLSIVSALLVCSAASASAQMPGKSTKPMMSHDMKGMSAMSCPMEPTNLHLTAKQDSAFAKLRAEHMAEMKALDSVRMREMEASMNKTFTAMRLVLTPAQQATFDKSVADHKAEMAKMNAQGKDAMAACGNHEMMMKMKMTPKKP